MDYYYYIALVIVAAQLLFSLQVYRNYRYALAKYKKKRSYRPRTALLVPCKGLDPAFDKNIASFFNQDCEDYILWFVVAEKSDPAYPRLCELKNKLSQTTKAHDVQILVAGNTNYQPAAGNEQRSCSQKIHNLLYGYNRIPDDIEVLAFADSDICVRSDWLSHLIYPLRKSKIGVATGYRWFIPQKKNLPTLALSAVNAKIVQLLGNTHLNHAWGGSMAIRTELFRQLNLDKIWPKTISDDLSLTYAVKKAHLKVAFVPACLVASYELTTWPKLFEFGRRQFLITRITALRTWWFGLASTIFSILGLWGTIAIAIYAATKSQIESSQLAIFIIVPILFFAALLTRAILRQKLAHKLLKYGRQPTSDEHRAMKAVAAADILCFWLWSLLLLFFIISSAFGRTIRWRGIRYKLLSPTETMVIGN